MYVYVDIYVYRDTHIYVNTHTYLVNWGHEKADPNTLRTISWASKGAQLNTDMYVL